MMEHALAAAVMVLAAGLSAAAQSNAQLYRSCRWWAPAGAPCTAGFAAAGVALTVDATALAATISDDDSSGGSCTATARGSCSSGACAAANSGASITMQTDSGPGTCYVDIVWTDRWGARSATVTDAYPVNSSPTLR